MVRESRFLEVDVEAAYVDGGGCQGWCVACGLLPGALGERETRREAVLWLMQLLLLHSVQPLKSSVAAVTTLL